MDVRFFSTLENIQNQVNDSTMNVLEHIEDESLKAKYLKSLEEVLESCVSCQHKVAIERQAVKEAIARAQDDTNGEPSTNLFDELVEESIGELEEDSPLEEALVQASSIKAFKGLLETHNANTEQNEDLIATEYSHSLIDPISKKRMTDPVRNKHCHHVYDRQSVTSMIAAMSKKGFKCPAVGCNNRQGMKLSDLEDAPDVKRQLQQRDRH